jgi:hypothetical protein
MPPTFDHLKKNYPVESREALFRALGGGWPALIPDPERKYQNTCAIRMSVALKRSGVAIPGAYAEMKQGDGTPIVIKVKTMQKLVASLYGEPWGMSKPPGIPLKASDIPNKTGIIVYHAGWSDATGHFDLWTGRGFVGKGNLGDVAEGFDIALWFVP